jgi:integrase/recombinase XerD
LSTEGIRAYLVHLVNACHVSPSTFNQVRCALRFFYRLSLDRDWSLEHIACQREQHKLPVVLSVPVRRCASDLPLTLSSSGMLAASLAVREPAPPRLTEDSS